MAKRGSSEFINLTLTEFLMVIIFVLITLLFHTFEQNKPVPVENRLTPKEVAQIESDAARLSRELFHENTARNTKKKQIVQFLEKMDKALSTPEAQASLKDTSLPEIWNTLTAGQLEIADLEKQIMELAETVGNEDIGKAVRTLTEKTVKLENKLAETHNKLSHYDPLLAEFEASTHIGLVKKIQNQSGQFKNLIERAERQGIGNPLCWANAEGEKEFLFSIAILESGMFRVTPIYPQHRELDLQGIGYQYPEKIRTFTQHQFKKQMRPFWNYGQRNNACRFFVKVEDLTLTKASWKRGLALVESYFYKMEVR